MIEREREREGERERKKERKKLGKGRKEKEGTVKGTFPPTKHSADIARQQARGRSSEVLVCPTHPSTGDPAASVFWQNSSTVWPAMHERHFGVYALQHPTPTGEVGEEVLDVVALLGLAISAARAGAGGERNMDTTRPPLTRPFREIFIVR